MINNNGFGNLGNKIADIAKTFMVPIHKEGIVFILIFAVTTLILALISGFLGTVGLVLTLWCVYFFRNPVRFTPQGDNLVISPADGVVQKVEQNVSAPDDLSTIKPTEKFTRISVFLNVFNVHVNRVPASGKITDLNYNPGKFLNADDEAASTENERQSCVLKTKDGKKIIFAQVAGLVARRIVCDLELNQEVEAGEVFGIIRFGSRADIYLPKSADIKVLEGQTMIAGETVLANFAAASSVKPSPAKKKKAPVKAKKVA